MKGAATIWVLALVGLGMAALIYIILNHAYVGTIEPIADSLINTTSVQNNLDGLTSVWAALPWALVIFFIAFIVAQGQKRFPGE